MDIYVSMCEQLRGSNSNLPEAPILRFLALKKIRRLFSVDDILEADCRTLPCRTCIFICRLFHD